MIRRNGFTMTAIGVRQRASSGIRQKTDYRLLKKISGTGHVLNDLNGLNVWNCFRSLLRDKRMQDHAHDAEHDGAEEGPPKS